MQISTNNKWKAIDADGHVLEPDEMFQEYMDPKYRARAGGYRPDGNGAMRYFFDGVAHPPFPKEISIRKPMEAANRMMVLDNEEIEAAVLFPSAVLFADYVGEAAFGQAIIQGFNNWIADYVRPYDGRMFFAAPVVLHDVDWAIAEAERSVKLGAAAICVRPNPAQAKTLDAPAYDRFYAAVQDLSVPLIVHEGTGHPDTVGGDRYGMNAPQRYAFSHVISHPFEQMFAALSIICGGVLERHPRLKVGFFEAGCSWAPYWLARLDDHFEHRILGTYMPIKLRPSEYFERQCVVTCDPHDATIPLAIQGIGAHKVLFATDYPHFDSGGLAVKKFMNVPGIAPTDQRSILRDNAIDFFRLKVGATV